MKVIAFAAAVAAVFHVGAAEAQTFTSRAAFEAALGSDRTTITFEGLVGTPGYATYTAGGYYSCSGYTLAGVTFDSRGVSPYCPTYIFDATSSYALGGSADGMFDQLGGRFTLNVAANSFGFDFGSSSGRGDFTATIAFAGGGSAVASLSVQDPVNFFGYVGADAITSVTLRDPTDSAIYIKYDNVTYGSAVASDAPEPASWALMLVGFGALGGAMRRRPRAPLVA